MPASGTPTIVANVFAAMIVLIARPRSRYANESPTVAFAFGKMTLAPMPASARVTRRSTKLVANTPASVSTDMTTVPHTRNCRRP